jgi:valyl-tRNA synthetase
LRLLHPIMPFITEELWQKFPHEGAYLATSPWPRALEQRLDARAERDMEMLQELIVKIRNVRAEAGIDPSRRIDVLVHAENARNGKLVTEQADLVAALVRAGKVEVVDAFPEGLVSARGLVRNLEVAVPLAGLLDFDAERARLTKDLAKIDAELDARNRKLANESFLERAPAEVVEKERAIQREFIEKKRRIEATLATLGGGEARA